jgi:hypothetical protein
MAALDRRQLAAVRQQVDSKPGLLDDPTTAPDEDAADASVAGLDRTQLVQDQARRSLMGGSPR